MREIVHLLVSCSSGCLAASRVLSSHLTSHLTPPVLRSVGDPLLGGLELDQQYCSYSCQTCENDAKGPSGRPSNFREYSRRRQQAYEYDGVERGIWFSGNVHRGVLDQVYRMPRFTRLLDSTAGLIVRRVHRATTAPQHADVNTRTVVAVAPDQERTETRVWP